MKCSPILKMHFPNGHVLKPKNLGNLSKYETYVTGL